MSFQNSALLWVFALAAIPLLIHLFNKWRHKTVRWAAMEMLLLAAKQSRGANRIRHWLILAARVLALAALAAILARPLLGGSWLGSFGSSNLDAVIVLVDRSPSMERLDRVTGEPIRERGLDRLVETLSEHRSEERIILIDSATLTPLYVADIEQLKRLPQTRSSDAKADLPAMINRASRLITEEKIGSSEIWILSDLQRSSWRPDSNAWTAALATLNDSAQPPSVRLLAYEPGAIDDNSLRLINSLRQGDQINVEYEIQTIGNSPAQQIEVVTADSRYQDSLAEYTGSLTKQSEIPIEQDQLAGWYSLQLPADSSRNNNQIYGIYGENIEQASAWVGAQTPSTAVLQTALSLPSNPNQTFTISEDGSDLDWEQLSLVVWQSAPPNNDDIKQALQNYLQAGGQMLLLPPETALPADRADFFGLTWGNEDEAAATEFFRTGPRLTDAAPLQNFQNGAAFGFERVNSIKRRAPASPDAETLVRYNDGIPFLIRHPVGDNGQIYALSTRPNHRGWSSMSDDFHFFYLLQRLVDTGSQRLSGQLIAPVGSTLPKGGNNLSWEKLNLQDQEWSTLSNRTPLNSGIYRAGSQYAALNIPSQELQYDQVDSDAVEPLFDGLDFELFQQSVGEDDQLTREIWFLIGVILAFILLAEALLSLPRKKRPMNSDPFNIPFN